MKKLLIILLAVSFIGVSSNCMAELKYNYMEGKWEQVSPDSTLEYNYMEGEWDYVDPD